MIKKVEYKKADILKAAYVNISLYVFFILFSTYLIIDVGFGLLSILIMVFGGYNLGKILIDFALGDVYKVEGRCYSVKSSSFRGGIVSTTISIEDADGNDEEIKLDTSCGLWHISYSRKVIIYFTRRSKIILGGENITKKKGEGKIVLIIFGIMFALILLLVLILNIIY